MHVDLNLPVRHGVSVHARPSRVAFALACAVAGSAAAASPPILLPDPSPDPLGSIGSSAVLTPSWLVVGAREKRFLTPARVMHSYGALVLWPRASGGDPDPVPTVVWPLSPFRGARFGESLALDGGRLLVGEPGYKPTATAKRAQGRAQIVDLSLETPAAVEVIGAPAVETGLEFGTAVALDGATAAITALGFTPAGATSETGAAYLFERQTPPEGPTWVLTRTLLPPEVTADPPAGQRLGFGSSVALTADQVLVGAPAAFVEPGLEYGRVYLFDRVGGGYLAALTAPTPALGDRFGASMALAASTGGTLLAVAAPGDECGLGEVHLFRHGPKGWIAEATLSAPGGAADGWIGFGNSLAIDRERIVVGTGGIRSGEEYGWRSAVYRRAGPSGSAGSWIVEAVIDGDPSDPTGSPVAIDPAGVVSAEPSIGFGQVRYVGLERSADLDFDGHVGAGDLAIFLGSWGDGVGSPADLNGDGVADQADLAILLGEWS